MSPSKLLYGARLENLSSHGWWLVRVGANEIMKNEKKANLVRWLTIEKVWVVLRWKTVEFEDVHEIVELAVDVAANRELFAVRNIHVNQRRLSFEIRQNIHQNLKANGKHKTPGIIVMDFGKQCPQATTQTT